MNGHYGPIILGFDDRQGNTPTIGARYVGIQGHGQQPYLVLREATREEWLASALDNGHTPNAAALDHASRPGCKFYEVSTD